jgi:hypothetical protein
MATRWVPAEQLAGGMCPCRRPEYKKCCEAPLTRTREEGVRNALDCSQTTTARKTRNNETGTCRRTRIKRSAASAQETRAVVGDGVPADAWSAGKFMKQRRSLKMSAVAGVVVKMIVRFERRPWCNLRASDTAVPVSGQPVDNCNLNLKRVCTRVRSAWTCGVVRLLCGWLFSLP